MMILISKEELSNLYTYKNMSISTIADKFNSNYYIIYKLLIKFNIPRRTPWEHRFGKKHTNITKLKMSKSHIGIPPWNKGLTKEINPKIKEIAKTISNSLKGKKKSEKHIFKIGISSKENWKQNRDKMMACLRVPKPNMSIIMKKMFNEGKLPVFIGAKGKNNLMYGKIGKDNPNWQGGTSFRPYTLDFNKAFKEAIRNRDNFCCVICNKPQEELGYKLHIHHIDYNKLNSFPQNCASLCRLCHINTNFNRDHWKSFFQKILAERYGYKYTEDQKIVLDF